MLAHSDEAAAQVAAGATTAERGRIIRGGETLVDFDSLIIVEGASVAIDGNAASVRQFTGSVADPDGLLAPHVGTDALAPFGSELVYELGIYLPSTGEYEWVPAGVFRLDKAAYSGRLIRLENAPDRSAPIARARNEAPYVIHGGTLYNAVNDYAQAKFPGLPFLADPGAAAVSLVGAPRVFQEGSISGDPWSDLRSLAADFGRRLSLDPTGTLILELIPDPAEAEVAWVYEPGAANLAVGAEAIMDTTGLYNVWVVSGSGTGIDPPVTATVEVTDTADPMYAGPGTSIGRRPSFYSSTFLTTVDQCRAVGEGLRLAARGSGSSISFTAAPNPFHEPFDVIRFGSDVLGVSVTLALLAWTLPGTLRSPVTYRTAAVA